jgi:EAL domain-containing protein (putative c-di-GMP-specific phosphodiesterase class I)
MKKLGCDEAQGFLLGRPVPNVQFDSLFGQTAAKRGKPGRKRAAAAA